MLLSFTNGHSTMSANGKRALYALFSPIIVTKLSYCNNACLFAVILSDSFALCDHDDKVIDFPTTEVEHIHLNGAIQT